MHVYAYLLHILNEQLKQQIRVMMDAGTNGKHEDVTGEWHYHVQAVCDGPPALPPLNNPHVPLPHVVILYRNRHMSVV